MGEPSLPLLGFVEGSYFGSGTNFLFPSQLVSPLPQTEKMLPGLLEMVWCVWEDLKQPQSLVPEVPSLPASS